MLYKLALLIGNRFNPWHFRGYRRLTPQPAITVFRAESEIQQYFDERDDGSAPFAFERIAFDTQAGPWLTRLGNQFQTRYANRPPALLPFHDRLRGFDLVQSWELFTDWSEQAAIARERYGTPLVSMVWDNIPFNMERTPRQCDIKARVMGATDRFIVHTERSRRMLHLEGVDDARIVRIPPGVDLDTFTSGSGNRARYKLDPDAFVLLFVGWFLPRKGLEFLLYALRELLEDSARKGRKIQLLMVGSGPGKDRIDTLVRRLRLEEACVFAGSVPYSEMPTVFRSVDAFVLPSIATDEWQEQFGMALIEAMACTTPCVTTWSGAIAEIAQDAAVMCQPNDFVALTEAIKMLMEDPGACKRFSAAGRKNVENHFSLAHFACGMDAVYKEVLNQTNS